MVKGEAIWMLLELYVTCKIRCRATSSFERRLARLARLKRGFTTSSDIHQPVLQRLLYIAPHSLRFLNAFYKRHYEDLPTITIPLQPLTCTNSRPLTPLNQDDNPLHPPTNPGPHHPRPPSTAPTLPDPDPKPRDLATHSTSHARTRRDRQTAPSERRPHAAAHPRSFQDAVSASGDRRRARRVPRPDRRRPRPGLGYSGSEQEPLGTGRGLGDGEEGRDD